MADFNSRNIKYPHPRVLCYREKAKQARFIPLIYIGFMLFICSCTAGILAMLEYSEHNRENFLLSTGPLAFYLFLITGLLSAFVITFQLWSKYKDETIQVYPDKFVCHRKDRTQEVKFADITDVQFTKKNSNSPRLVFKIKDQPDFWIGWELERSEYILESLSKFSPKFFESIDYLELRQKFILFDHHYSIKSKIWTDKALILGVFLIQLGYLLWKSSELKIQAILPYILSGLFPTALFILIPALIVTVIIRLSYAKRLAAQLAANPNNKIIDFRKQIRIYNATYCAHFAVYLFIAFLNFQYDLPMLGIVSPSQQTVSLSHGPAGMIWIDKRVNCTSCAYSLNVGDTIVTSAGFGGEVVGVPRQIVPLVSSEQDLRGPAAQDSAKKVQKHLLVQDGQVAMKFLNGETVRIVEQTEILGRVLPSWKDFFKSLP